jgi:hypothetical protein
MGEVAAELAAVYRSTFDTPYQRPEPRMAEAMADSLNNRAVSLMDLGRAEQAHAVWVQALRADPHHPESTFNSGLYRWREGGLTDDAFRLRLEDVRRFHPGQDLPAYLLGQFFLEQGNYLESKRVLRPFRDSPNVREEWREAERIARERRPMSRALSFELSGHNDAVTSLTHLAGQRALVSGSADNTLKIWNCETHRCEMTLEGHSNSVTAVCSSADGRLIFSASRDRTVRCWEVATGRQLHVLQGAQGELSAVGVTRTHRRVVAAGLDGTLRVWDNASGECESVLNAHRGGVTTMALSSGGKYASQPAKTDNRVLGFGKRCPRRRILGPRRSGSRVGAERGRPRTAFRGHRQDGSDVARGEWHGVAHDARPPRRGDRPRHFDGWTFRAIRRKGRNDAPMGAGPGPLLGHVYRACETHSWAILAARRRDRRVRGGRWNRTRLADELIRCSIDREARALSGGVQRSLVVAWPGV